MDQNDPCFDLSSDLIPEDDDYIAKNIETVYPLLKECIINSKDDAAISRSIDIAFRHYCLDLFAIEELEEKIFGYACPAAKNLFVKTLKSVGNFEEYQNQTQTDVGEVVSNLLHVCLQIMSSLQNGLKFLCKVKTVNISNVKSLSEATVEILYNAYSHCRESEKIYGNYFNKLTDVLNTLFKKSSDLQSQLLSLLTEKMVFKSEIADELELLDRILIYVYKSGIVIMSLDPKTMADLWKGYATLTGKYSEHLKDHHNVAEPINSLCKKLIENIETIAYQEKPEFQSVLKSIKISSFMLKLVIKLCEQFKGYLGNCHKSLVRLLIMLFKYSHPYLELNNIPENIDSEITKHLSIGSDALLSPLLADRGMVREFHHFSSNQENNLGMSYGFLLLCCSVLKKLTLLDLETRKMWFGSDYNTIDWIFTSLRYCHYEFSIDLKFQSCQIPGKAVRKTDLYEHVLIITSAFILTLNGKEFNIVENILMKSVLQTNPWPALLAMDVWCIVARFADADFCYSQLLILCRMLNRFPAETNRPEKVFLTTLIRRLFPLLTQSQKDEFTKTFPVDKHPDLWRLFGILNLSANLISETESSIYVLGNSKIKKFLSFEKDDNSSFCNMERALLAADQQFLDQNSSFEESIVDLWKFNPNVELPEPFIERYLKTLCLATISVIPSMSTANLRIVLEQMKQILSSCKILSVSLYFTSILDALATVSITPGHYQQIIVSSISSIFSTLLTSKSVLIRQRALETFSRFSRVTKHPEVVSLSVNNNPSLRAEMSRYLLKKQPELKRNVNVNEFLKEQSSIKREHYCEKYVGNEIAVEYESGEPSLKKPKLDSDAIPILSPQTLINRFKDKTESLSRCLDSLTDSQRKQVRNICSNLLDLINKSR